MSDISSDQLSNNEVSTPTDLTPIVSTPLTRRMSYTLDLKRRIVRDVEAAKNNGIKYPQAFVADKESLDKRTVSKWCKNVDSILSVEHSGQKRKLSIGRPPKYTEVEEEIVGWITHLRSLAAPVSARMVAAKILKDHPDLFCGYNKCLGWVYNMLNRHHLSIRRKTQDQKTLTEEEMGTIHLDFVQHVSSLVDFHSITPDRIINMDETGCYFDVGINTTIEFTGSKTVRVASTNNINTCTVFLAVTFSGIKLKPVVVFKGVGDGTVAKRMNSSSSQIDARIIACCQKKAYCDEEIMAVWVEKSLAPFIESKSKQLHLMMMDNFSPHQTKSVRDSISELGCLLTMLPPNMTSRVQVLDVGINKPFKDNMRWFYSKFLVENAGTKPKITREVMSKWIADSWELVSTETILNSCKKIGFI
jgi:hypothetical protein